MLGCGEGQQAFAVKVIAPYLLIHFFRPEPHSKFSQVPGGRVGFRPQRFRMHSSSNCRVVLHCSMYETKRPFAKDWQAVRSEQRGKLSGRKDTEILQLCHAKHMQSRHILKAMGTKPAEFSLLHARTSRLFCSSPWGIVVSTVSLAPPTL